MLTPDEIADGLTGAQAREAVRCFLHALHRFDETNNSLEFQRQFNEAVTFTERLAGEVPA